MAHEQDMTLKYISGDYLKKLISMLPKDINIEIDETTEIEVLTEEQISIEPSLYRPDLIVRVGNVILMIEFESTFVGRIKKKRYKVYISNFDLKKNKENRKIIFLVISTAEYTKISKYSINELNTFQFPIISLFEINEREIISNIKEKINNQERFSDEELIALALTPIMVRGRDNIISQFEEIVLLMDEIKYNTEQIKESIYGIAILLGNMYLDKYDPMRKKILGDFMNKVDCIAEYGEEQYNAGMDKGLKEGEKRGKIEGKIEIIRNMLNDGEISVENAISRLISLNCGLGDISEITGLSIDEIKKYQNLE